MVLFSIVLSFFCVLIFYCFNKRISVSPKPGMVYINMLHKHKLRHESPYFIVKMMYVQP